MSMFGLKEAEVAQLVRAVLPDAVDPTREEIEEIFARTAWSGIVEPGDGVAGELIAQIGAPAALRALVDQHPAERIRADHDVPLSIAELGSAIERWKPRLSATGSLLALRQAARFGARLLVPGLPHWPDRLDELGEHAPLALWVRGNLGVVDTLDRSISLVGARAATGYGEHVTMEASAGLVDLGYTIVSGAAYGIDGMAHRSALASKGLTVAFLAGGVDRFYPSGHDALLTRIVESGAVISELPCGLPPTKWRFLQRNRLIAAAGLATIVLEAGWRSGSLNTAGHAGDLGRPLGAVPGPVTSAASSGCHRLLREYHAVCVTTAAEMAELAPLAEHSAADERRPPPDHAATRVLDALAVRARRQVDDVAARSGFSLADVRAVLGRLELDGIVHHDERGWRRLT